MDEPLVKVEKPFAGVAHLVLNRPDRLNAMSIDLVIQLWDALGAVADDNEVSVVVISGEGRAFCSGLDLHDYGIIPNIDGLPLGRIAQRSMRYYSRLIGRMRSLPQPIIAAVNGPAYGGGMCLAIGAEIRFADPSAVFNATGIVNGLTSTEMGIGWLLTRSVGWAMANDILLTGRRIDATEAFAMGLVSRVSRPGEVVELALATAETMCGFSAYGLEMTKAAVWAELEIASLDGAIEFEDRNQLMLGFTDNLPEAIRGFRERRSPVYTDEPRRDVWASPAPTRRPSS